VRRLVVGPEAVAEHIADSVERGRGETSFPWYYGLAGLIQALAPNGLRRVLARPRGRSTID
jgi:hypothetical protein